MTHDEQLALLEAHGDAERRFDVEATMATMDPNPAYEWHPDGRRIEGTAAVRAMYEAFLSNWERLSQEGTLEFGTPRGEWFNDEGRIREEVTIVHHPDGTSTRYDYVVVVLTGERGIRGERTYGSPDLLRVLMGPHYDTLPITP